MRKKLTQSSLRGPALTQVRHVAPVSYGAAEGRVARIYQELERDFGMLAPPIALHSPAPDVLAASWLMLRETLLVPGVASRAEKEAVASSVSASNECPYCLRMHAATLSSVLPPASRADRAADPLTDPSVRALADWARENSFRDTAGQSPAPFSSEPAPEFVASAVLLHYHNRMVNVFLGELPLPPKAPLTALGPVMRVVMWLIGSAARTSVPSGTSMELLPAAPLADDLSWAASNPSIADAYSRATAAVDEAGRRSAPESVRDLLGAELDAWDGRPPGISRAWVDERTAALPPEDRPAGRLALLTALASYQVDDTVVAAFRATHPEDSALIDLTSWAALSAARRIGSWMQTKS
ncbi:carboxymuconolactone decarboxylase family protein [Actinacidiphila acididurans]|uniref:Carboxymuconolactone decarboxylase family protein n=1 Tax=Actinacidiphila acididurans TaxID=2784346 RepID=A0ABS2U230_9ACTN|nr:carboxymuconolactone decarboxylase family protein [Actinacidiphila acididurans]MBM9509657.1 carboxymuconolactone decarboxylase family protein [Actinacidiphila acididurans]